jgi:hypothetical protein
MNQKLAQNDVRSKRDVQEFPAVVPYDQAVVDATPLIRIAENLDTLAETLGNYSVSSVVTTLPVELDYLAGAVAAYLDIFAAKVLRGNGAFILIVNNETVGDVKAQLQYLNMRFEISVPICDSHKTALVFGQRLSEESSPLLAFVQEPADLRTVIADFTPANGFLVDPMTHSSGVVGAALLRGRDVLGINVDQITAEEIADEVQRWLV